jgi:septum formation protein
MKRKIILASTSPRRKELFEKTGLTFEVVPGKYEEDMTLPLSPLDLAIHLSKGKAQSLVGEYSDAIIIGADTFVSYDNKVIGKPHTPEKARATLSMLRGNCHGIITGFTIIDTRENKIISRAVETKVYFRNFSDKEMEDYITTGEPLDKAGSYGIQALGKGFVEKIEGDYDNIIGLPIGDLMSSLKEFGIE